MTIGAAVIFTLVLVLAGYALLRSPAKRRPLSSTALIVGGGVAFPVVVLSALLVYAVSLTGALRAGDGPEPLAIQVVAHQFWWEVLYPGTKDERVASANEIRIPAGRPVTVSLTSRDVIHSFWVPNLAGKIDIIPGRVTRLTLEASAPGTFRGQCAEFCGASHAHMAFAVVVLAEAEFSGWLASIARPARQPIEASARRGREAFVAEGCVKCHAVRGLSAPPDFAAPDLTHVASRAFIGAGALPNTREARIVWLSDGERVKPGRAMPSFKLDPATLGALADYLGSLE